MPRVTTQLAIMVAIVVLAAIVVFAGPAACNKMRSMAAQGRVQHSQGEAHANSAADAVGTVAASGEASAASEELTRSNEKDIRNAKGSNAAVDPAARDAGIRAICLRNASRDDPKCKLLQPHS
jgi:hypothetical protein